MPNKRMNQKKTALLPVAKGLAAAGITSFSVLAVMAIALTRYDVSESAAVALALTALAAGAFAGGFAAAGAQKSRGLAVGGWIGGIVWLITAAAALIVNGAQWSALTPVKAALCVAFGMIGGVLGVNASARRKLKSR